MLWPPRKKSHRSTGGFYFLLENRNPSLAAWHIEVILGVRLQFVPRIRR
jgi:hypothetical protein